MNPQILDYYATPGPFTSLDEADAVAADVRTAVEIVRGLLVYDVVAEPWYGAPLSAEQADAIHERDTSALLGLVRRLDSSDLAQPRPPQRRVGARCHIYSRLTVALLRASGVPARARCGFGTYFRPGWLEDHWVAEYWNPDSRGWQMIDAQLDETWQRMINFSGDAFALTASEFVTAGHAWQAWRRGELDADRCGLSAINEHGAFWIAGNLRLDFASLNKVEMLPWDVWGAGWKPGESPDQETLGLFDTVAELTVSPDDRFDDVRERYATDSSLRMTGTVFNVLRGTVESVAT